VDQIEIEWPTGRRKTLEKGSVANVKTRKR
jgi:hypothetical protein